MAGQRAPEVVCHRRMACAGTRRRYASRHGMARDTMLARRKRAGDGDAMLPMRRGPPPSRRRQVDAAISRLQRRARGGRCGRAMASPARPADAQLILKRARLYFIGMVAVASARDCRRSPCWLSARVELSPMPPAEPHETREPRGAGVAYARVMPPRPLRPSNTRQRRRTTAAPISPTSTGRRRALRCARLRRRLSAVFTLLSRD